MKHISVSDGVIPLGEFKSHAPRYLKNLDSPLIITQNGRPAAVLMSPAEYDLIRQQQSFLESIAAGMNDIHAGRVMNEETLNDRLATARKMRCA